MIELVEELLYIMSCLLSIIKRQNQIIEQHNIIDVLSSEDYVAISAGERYLNDRSFLCDEKLGGNGK